MSWGERSCIHINTGCPAGIVCEMHTCNVDCSAYEWDGTTEKDSTSKYEKPKERVPVNKPKRGKLKRNAAKRARRKNRKR